MATVQKASEQPCSTSRVIAKPVLRGLHHEYRWENAAYEGSMTAPEKLSAEMILERGGTSVVTDTAGNLYLASGQIFIYNKQREQIGILEVPERPSSLAWGGPDGKTLFTGARSSMYAIRTVNQGARPQ